MKALEQILLNGKKKLAILIDPEKTHTLEKLNGLIEKINILKPAFIFVGGSTVSEEHLDASIRVIKKRSSVPIIIFPGSQTQVHELADGILFLSLISGRNPDYLIGHQVKSAHIIKKMNLEVIPTGYILIDGEKSSSVAYVSQTTPIPNDQNGIAVQTAIAGEMLGLKAIFMDAGSGAHKPVRPEMIGEVKQNINIPLIIGGGIKCIKEAEAAYSAGADIVVIGNKIEENIDFLLDLKGLMKN